MTNLLQRLLSHLEMGGAVRLAKAVRSLVDGAKSGSHARLKGTSIAINLFGRTADFDPQSDVVLRREVCRLRHALARFYVGPGA